jgi:hypothetical protein
MGRGEVIQVQRSNPSFDRAGFGQFVVPSPFILLSSDLSFSISPTFADPFPSPGFHPHSTRAPVFLYRNTKLGGKSKPEEEKTKAERTHNAKIAM